MRLSSYILITNVVKSNELNLDLAFTEETTGLKDCPVCVSCC